MKVQDFIAKAQANAIATAKRMASIELSAWDSSHENSLKENFGFTSESVAERKTELIHLANS